jgi:hypothetical protein
VFRLQAAMPGRALAERSAAAHGNRGMR